MHWFSANAWPRAWSPFCRWPVRGGEERKMRSRNPTTRNPKWERYGGFLKWWVSPTTMGFPTKNHHFGVFWGYHHLRKHPYRSQHWLNGDKQSSPQKKYWTHENNIQSCTKITWQDGSIHDPTEIGNHQIHWTTLKWPINDPYMKNHCQWFPFWSPKVVLPILSRIWAKKSRGMERAAGRMSHGNPRILSSPKIDSK